ncbi:MAG TPA: hypothetical protein VEH57_00900 [Thermoplasmata archaeon]|nr:hypothetical protein [Thermoplasmata archaeon]
MALSPFSSVDRSTLNWLRTSEGPVTFTLSAGDRPVAVLRCPPAGGGQVTVDTSSGPWSLTRTGFLYPRVGLHAAGASKPMAQLTAHLHRHVLTTEDGASFGFQRAGMLVPAWKLSTSAGDEVAHVEPVATGRRLTAGAVIVPEAQVGLPNLLPLLVLAWYFVTLVWFEDEAVETLAPFEGPDAPVAIRPSP